MSDIKISQLPLLGCVNPTALVPLVQCGITFSTYACNIGGGGGGGVIISGIGTSCCSSYRCGVGNTLCDANNSANLGGRSHFISGGYSTLVGGECNTVGAGFGGYFPYNFIGGGCCNRATGCCDSGGDYGTGTNTVVGGVENIADGAFGFIGGGCRNTSGYAASSVVGGYFNTVSNAYSFIGGGVSNIASNQFDSVTGGKQNNASGGYSFIGAGILNNVSGCGAVVVGGFCNRALGAYGFIGGGCCNGMSQECLNTIIAGYLNCIDGVASFGSIIGGSSNSIFCSCYSTIGSAAGNFVCSSDYSFSGSGLNAVICDSANSFIGTGSLNCIVSSGYSTIVNGLQNCVVCGSFYSAILGGMNNIIECKSCAYIIGNNICAVSDCTLHANCLWLGSLPTSAAGLPAGSVWNNGGVLNIV
jgi:hypothetical protein